MAEIMYNGERKLIFLNPQIAMKLADSGYGAQVLEETDNPWPTLVALFREALGVDGSLEEVADGLPGLMECVRVLKQLLEESREHVRLIDECKKLDLY